MTTTYLVTEKTRLLAHRREQEVSAISCAHSDHHPLLHTHPTILRLFRSAPTLPTPRQHTASRLHSKLSTTDTMQVYPRVQTPPLTLYGVQRADTPSRNAKRSHLYYTERAILIIGRAMVTGYPPRHKTKEIWNSTHFTPTTTTVRTYSRVGCPFLYIALQKIL